MREPNTRNLRLLEWGFIKMGDVDMLNWRVTVRFGNILLFDGWTYRFPIVSISMGTVSEVLWVWS